MRRLLITGGAGFIGSNFVRYWLARHPQDYLIILDALTYAGNLANLNDLLENPNLKFIHANLINSHRINEILLQENIDTIVHFAAESHVDRSIDSPEAFIQTNIVGTFNLLEAAKKNWLNNISNRKVLFHHVSTDEVYGSLDTDDQPFNESTPYAPNSPYAASKASSDYLVRAYSQTYNLPVTMSNCSNNFGPYQYPEKLIPLLITNILNGQPLPIYGDGKNIRDWLYVEDHCYGIELILNHGKTGESYNIGTDNERTNIEITHLICNLLDEKFENNKTLFEKYPNCPMAHGKSATSLITFVKDRLGHDKRYAINAAKIKEELGFSPSFDFNVSLNKTVEWYLNNNPWWSVIAL